MVSMGSNATFDLFWVFGQLKFELPRFDDVSTRGGPVIGKNRSTTYTTWFGTDQSKPISSTSRIAWRPQGESEGFLQLMERIGIRPLSRLTMEGEVNYAKYKDPFKWVTSKDDVNGERADIMAHLSNRKMDFITRITFLFTSDLSLQLYNQLFWALGDYGTFSRLQSPYSTTGLEDVDYTGNPDFYKNVSNTSLVLRWEFRPGSTFYTVWSHGINRSETPENGRLYNGLDFLKNADANNSFLVKFDYRFLMNL